jgi:hypothetical protein
MFLILRAVDPSDRAIGPRQPRQNEICDISVCICGTNFLPYRALPAAAPF